MSSRRLQTDGFKTRSYAADEIPGPGKKSMHEFLPGVTEALQTNPFFAWQTVQPCYFRHRFVREDRRGTGWNFEMEDREQQEKIRE